MEDEGQYWARKFEELRERYRRDDGSRWTGAALERATDRRVTVSWVSKLSRGQYQDPGFSKVAAISTAMGIPLEEWLEECNNEGAK